MVNISHFGENLLTDDGEQVLCMPRISLSPGHINERINLPSSMISLVESHCYQTCGDWLHIRKARPPALVPVIEDGIGNIKHTFLSSQSGMKEPEAGYLRGIERELIEAEDSNGNPSNGI